MSTACWQTEPYLFLITGNKYDAWTLKTAILQLAVKKGYRIVVISGANTEAVKSGWINWVLTMCFCRWRQRKKISRVYKNQRDWLETDLFMEMIYLIMQWWKRPVYPVHRQSCRRHQDIAKYISTSEAARVVCVMLLKKYWIKWTLEMDTGVASRWVEKWMVD